MVLGYCCGSTGSGKEQNKSLLDVNEREREGKLER